MCAGDQRYMERMVGFILVILVCRHSVQKLNCASTGERLVGGVSGVLYCFYTYINHSALTLPGVADKIDSEKIVIRKFQQGSN